jgi:hypothetical protein
VTAGGHRADEHAVITGVALHPDAIAEQRAAGDRARRVDRDDRHGPLTPTQLGDQGSHQRALA